MSKICIDESGNRYGKLTVLSRGENNKIGTARWICKCDCGNLTLSLGTSLRNGGAASCGCNSGKDRSGEAPMKIHYRGYRNGANSRNLIFDLSYEEYKRLIYLPCYYCGNVPKDKHFSFHRTRYSRGIETDESLIFNGLDRIDNSMGYTKENTVTCCKICNGMKSNLDCFTFISQINKIYNNLSNGLMD